jgi:predicted 3-demethylubiquinone-9 3-methyltransferase (glyoxalase superfamily)
MTATITPFLWFDTQAEQAAKFYCSVFKNSKLLKTLKRGEGVPGPVDVLTVEFEINGQRFTALNGGPLFKFNESVSFVVNCKDQKELDYYWDKLTSAGGAPSQCGWLKDQFGLSWQVIPEALPKLLQDPKRGPRAMQALMKMSKLDIARLEQAGAE